MVTLAWISSLVPLLPLFMTGCGIPARLHRSSSEADPCSDPTGGGVFSPRGRFRCGAPRRDGGPGCSGQHGTILFVSGHPIGQGVSARGTPRPWCRRSDATGLLPSLRRGNRDAGSERRRSERRFSRDRRRREATFRLTAIGPNVCGGGGRTHSRHSRLVSGVDSLPRKCQRRLRRRHSSAGDYAGTRSTWRLRELPDRADRGGLRLVSPERRQGHTALLGRLRAGGRGRAGASASKQ